MGMEKTATATHESAGPGTENGPGDAAIHISGLTKRYNERVAVDGVDLTIHRGEVVALLGPNGAGKSTTVDMILGLTRPDSGTVTVFGRTPTEAIRASQVCAMLQEGTLLEDASVYDIVAMVAALHAHPMPVAEALRRAGVADLAKQRSTRLSGGQKQRVRFAVALVGNPDLLILDEPTAAMDVATRREFWESMRHFTDEGRTVVFATHYLEEAEEFADRVVLMRHGKIVRDGTVSQIKSAASGRILRVVVPGGDLGQLLKLPGVLDGTQRGDRFELKCSASDAPVQALLAMYPRAHDIEIKSMGLEEAFLLLTSDDAKPPTNS